MEDFMHLKTNKYKILTKCRE